MLLVLGLFASGCGSSAAAGAAGGGGTGGGGASGTGGSAGSGDAGAGGASGSDGGSGSPGDIVGCEGVSLLAKPDYGHRGPWPVGAKTITIVRGDGRELLTEIWYPAQPGSEAGKTADIYDMRQSLPPASAAKVPDADNPWQPCDGCWRDLPLDAAHGPYPLVVFVHGTAGFRGQNLENVVHWASRGFVVMAANHPGLYLGDMVNFAVAGQDLAGDVKLEIATMTAHAGELAAFAGHVDLTRLGASGHSAGGGAVAPLGDLPGMQVVVPISGGGAPSGANLRSSLLVAGMIDQTWAGAQTAYDGASPKKRLLGITGIAHAGVTSLCNIRNAKGQDIVTVAQADGVMTPALAGLAAGLFDCAKDTEPEADAIAVINYTSAAVLEETLHCDSTAAAALAATQAKHAIAGDWRETP
jgi:dienelactone hydrolase